MASWRNPQVKDTGEAPRPSTHPKDFQTHIPEPTWQRVTVLIFVVIAIIFWVWMSKQNWIN